MSKENRPEQYGSMAGSARVRGHVVAAGNQAAKSLEDLGVSLARFDGNLKKAVEGNEQIKKAMEDERRQDQGVSLLFRIKAMEGQDNEQSIKCYKRGTVGSKSRIEGGTGASYSAFNFAVRRHDRSLSS